MANNCLVTKLKASVDNPDLPILGEVALFHATNQVTTSQKSFYLSSYDNSDIKLRCDKALFSNGSKRITISGGAGSVTLGEVTEDINISIIEDYTKLSEIVINDGTSSAGNGTAAFWNIIDETLLARMNHLTKYVVRNGITDFSNFPSSIVQIQMSNSSSSADIKDLGHCVSLTHLYFRNSQVTGELKEMAAAMVSNGKTYGNINVYCNGKITLDGTVVANGTMKKIHFSSSYPEGYSIS